MKAATGIRLVAMLAVTLGGCGTYSWQKPNASDQDFKADAQTCEGPPNRPAGDFDQCMQNLGWTLKK